MRWYQLWGCFGTVPRLRKVHLRWTQHALHSSLDSPIHLRQVTVRLERTWSQLIPSSLSNHAPPRNRPSIPNPLVSQTTASVVRAGDWESGHARLHPCLDNDLSMWLWGAQRRAGPRDGPAACVRAGLWMQPLCLEPQGWLSSYPFTLVISGRSFGLPAERR